MESRKIRLEMDRIQESHNLSVQDILKMNMIEYKEMIRIEAVSNLRVADLVNKYKKESADLWKLGVNTQISEQIVSAPNTKVEIDEGKLRLTDEAFNDTIDRELSDMVMREELTDPEKDRITSELW